MSSEKGDGFAQRLAAEMTELLRREQTVTPAPWGEWGDGWAFFGHEHVDGFVAEHGARAMEAMSEQAGRNRAFAARLRNFWPVFVTAMEGLGDSAGYIAEIAQAQERILELEAALQTEEECNFHAEYQGAIEQIRHMESRLVEEASRNQQQAARIRDLVSEGAELRRRLESAKNYTALVTEEARQDGDSLPAYAWYWATTHTTRSIDPESMAQTVGNLESITMLRIGKHLQRNDLLWWDILPQGKVTAQDEAGEPVERSMRLTVANVQVYLRQAIRKANVAAYMAAYPKDGEDASGSPADVQVDTFLRTLALDLHPLLAGMAGGDDPSAVRAWWRNILARNSDWEKESSDTKGFVGKEEKA